MKTESAESKLNRELAIAESLWEQYEQYHDWFDAGPSYFGDDPKKHCFDRRSWGSIASERKFVELVTNVIQSERMAAEKDTREQCSQEAAYEINKLTGSSGDTLAEAVAARLRGGI